MHVAVEELASVRSPSGGAPDAMHQIVGISYVGVGYCRGCVVARFWV